MTKKKIKDWEQKTIKKSYRQYSSTLNISFKNGNKMSWSAGIMKLGNFCSKSYRFTKKKMPLKGY